MAEDAEYNGRLMPSELGVRHAPIIGKTNKNSWLYWFLCKESYEILKIIQVFFYLRIIALYNNSNIIINIFIFHNSCFYNKIILFFIVIKPFCE